MKLFQISFTCLLGIAPDTSLIAAPKKSKRPAPAAVANPPEKVDANASEDGVIATSSTHIDFSETSIDGKMKAPEGFFLQGHNGSSLSQMVKLRSNFRNELRNSRSAVKSQVK